MRINLKSFLAVLFLVGQVYSGALAQKSSFNYDKNKVLKVNWMTEVYPPYNFADKGDNPAGIGVEVLEAVLKEMGRKSNDDKISIVPWAQAYNKIQNQGSYNGLFVMVRSKEREKMFKWFGPITDHSVTVIGLKSSPELVNAGELKKFTFITEREGIGQSTLTKHGVPESNIHAVTTAEQMVQMLRKGRAPYISYNFTTLKWRMKQLGIKIDDLEEKLKIDKKEVYFALNKAFPDSTVKAYQTAMDKVKKDTKLLKAIKQKYNAELSK
ncbi:MAG: substrate-binding periplasmic protein [Oligoflexales bacterium]